MIFHLKVPHCVFNECGCGLLFGLEYYFFPSYSLPSVFPYLLNCSTPFFHYWLDKLIMGKAPNFESPILIDVHRFFP
jgi:hypothetical protein